MRRRRMLTAQRKRGREVAAPKRKSDADQVIIVKKSDPGLVEAHVDYTPRPADLVID
jgi:hypothetical protein